MPVSEFPDNVYDALTEVMGRRRVLRHERIHEASPQVKRIVNPECDPRVQLEWIDDRIIKSWYIKLYYKFDGTWKQMRIKVSMMQWYKLNSPDIDMQFEAICWIRDHVQHLIRRLDDAQRGGYD